MELTKDWPEAKRKRMAPKALKAYTVLKMPVSKMRSKGKGREKEAEVRPVAGPSRTRK